MKEHYDFSKGFRNIAIAERRRKHGYTVTVYKDETETEIVEQYYVSPEEVEKEIAMREAWREERKTNKKREHATTQA